jgi:hypothetical protein
LVTVLLHERRPMPSSTYLHDPETRETLLDGPLGAILLLGAETSDGHLSLLEHPLAPRALGALVHTHRNEDEYSLVLEGTIGVEVGGRRSRPAQTASSRSRAASRTPSGTRLTSRRGSSS